MGLHYRLIQCATVTNREIVRIWSDRYLNRHLRHVYQWTQCNVRRTNASMSLVGATPAPGASRWQCMVPNLLEDVRHRQGQRNSRLDIRKSRVRLFTFPGEPARATALKLSTCAMPHLKLFAITYDSSAKCPAIGEGFVSSALRRYQEVVPKCRTVRYRYPRHPTVLMERHPS